MAIKIKWQYKDLAALADEIREAAKTEDVGDLAALYIELEDKLEAAGALKTALQKMFDGLRFARFPELMDIKGLSNFKTTGGDKLEVASDIRVGILEENRPFLFQWLRDRNSGDIIKETVNAQTLQAVVRRLWKEGKQDEFPVVAQVEEGKIKYGDDEKPVPLLDAEGKPIPVIKIEPYSSMKLTRKK